MCSASGPCSTHKEWQPPTSSQWDDFCSKHGTSVSKESEYAFSGKRAEEKSVQGAEALSLPCQENHAKIVSQHVQKFAASCRNPPSIKGFSLFSTNITILKHIIMVVKEICNGGFIVQSSVADSWEILDHAAPLSTVEDLQCLERPYYAKEHLRLVKIKTYVFSSSVWRWSHAQNINNR